MLRFILRRSLYSLLVLFGVMLLTFVLFRVAAGDPCATLLGKNPKPREIEDVRRSLGADKPLFWGKWRRTEAYTNAVFAKDRTSFTGVAYSGEITPGAEAVSLSPGAAVIFTRNFETRPGETLQLEIDSSGPLILNGQTYSPKHGTVTLPVPSPAPETLRLETGESSVRIAAARFYRETADPADSQLLASFKELVTFTKSFPFVSFFNFGRTLQTHEPIRSRLWQGMWPSLFLMLPIFFGELFFGLLFAMIACLKRDSRTDRVIMVFSVAGMSISYLALIIFGQWLLGYYWNLFPVWGWGDARFLALPVIIGIISGTGSGVRFYRTVFLNEINREYLRTAVAKGASPLSVYGKHLLRNSLIPIITRASSVLPFLFTGSLLLESFFGIPGLGNEGINALHDADLQLLKALVILGSILFVVINLLTDVVYAWADPRMRPEK